MAVMAVTTTIWRVGTVSGAPGLVLGFTSPTASTASALAATVSSSAASSGTSVGLADSRDLRLILLAEGGESLVHCSNSCHVDLG